MEITTLLEYSDRSQLRVWLQENHSKSTMTRIFVMESCPDCIQAKQLYGANPDYKIIDIGKQASDLKEFLALRDNHPAFAKVRERGTIGIPCFVKDDGDVVISLKHYLASSDITTSETEYSSGAACNLDGTGC